MNPSEVSASYDRLAPRWAGPDFNQANGIAQHKRALQFAKTGGIALDVGCGSSGRLIDLLLENRFEVEGLDLSPEMIRLARIRHPGLVFHQADICVWEPVKGYDFISAWDSIWHVPLAAQRSVIGKLCAALAPGGIMIFTAGGLDEAGEKQDAHMGVPMYHGTIGISEILRVIHESGCSCRHFEYDQFPELHVYFIAQKI